MKNQTNFDKVVQFMTDAGQLEEKGWDYLGFHSDRINEEAGEFLEEVANYFSLIEVRRPFFQKLKIKASQTNTIKELIDILYVTYGALARLGVDADLAFNEVHNSNMSKKVNGQFQKNKEGKVVKGPNYNPPNMEKFVRDDI